MSNVIQLEQVREFHRTYKSRIGSKPELPDKTERELRQSLLREEYHEYITGEENDDLVEIADALGDMMYIIYGTAISYGIPIDKIFDEIHRSNMSKLGLDGNPIYREDGKIMKGPNYFKPNLKKILDNNGN